MNAISNCRSGFRLGMAALLAIVLCATAAPVRATLVPVDEPRFGPAALVLDTRTGLEWLSLTHSIGLSPAQVLAELLPGGRFAGFRYASHAEFGALTTDFFAAPVCCLRLLDEATTQAFARLFGPTFTDADLSESRPGIDGYFGFLRDGRGDGAAGRFFHEASLGRVSGVYDQSSFTIRSPGSFRRGSYLVQSVSEPASISLLIASLLGVAAGALPRKRGGRSPARRAYREASAA